MRKYRTVRILIIYCFLTCLVVSSYSTENIALGASELLPLQLPRDPGHSQWDEGNIDIAFEPGNIRGRNPNYYSLGVSRASLDDGNSLEDDGGAGSANFHFEVPILQLPGRGLDLALSMHYNSRMWYKVPIRGRDTMIFDMDGDWPAPGWSLGFGKLIGKMLVEADGTRHVCSIDEDPSQVPYICRTSDGSFIDIWFYAKKSEVHYPDGTVVTFDVLGQWEENLRTQYPSKITDANGNYISITYRNSLGPHIETITDTMGRTVRFHYDQSRRLTAITAPGLNNSTRTLIRLHYRVWGLDYGFSPTVLPTDCESLTGRGPVRCWKRPYDVSTIDAIYFPDTSAGYWFGDANSFSPYGMLVKVSQHRAMRFSAGSLTEQGTVTKGIMTRERVYNYPLRRSNSLTDVPVYTTMTERWEGMDTAPAVTQYTIFKPTLPKDDLRTGIREDCGLFPPTRIEVTYPDRTRSIQLAYNRPCEFDHGLNYQTQILDAQGQVLQDTTIVWEPGDGDSARIERTELGNGLRGQSMVTEFGYGPTHNQVTEVRTYDFDGVSLLRRTEIEYVTDLLYDDYHIFNLPKVIEVFDGLSSVPATRVEYSYDEEPLADTPRVTGHSAEFNPYNPLMVQRCVAYEEEELEICDPYHESSCSVRVVQICTEYEEVSSYERNRRGNITTITRYTDAANQTGPVIEKHRYDITGNLISISGSCCVETTYTYSAVTQYAYPDVVTIGSSSPASKLSTSTTYDFNTAAVLSTLDANGSLTVYTYSTMPSRIRAIVQATGAVTTYDYDDTNLSIIETTYLQDDFSQIAAQTVQRFNGLGLVRRREFRADVDVQSWNVSETQYDGMGRVWRQTQPFLREADSTQEQKYWNEMTYDALGRLTRVLAADGSNTYYHFNEVNRPGSASPTSGETVRVVDPWQRERWMRTNALGQLVEVVMPNPNGSGSVFEPGSIATFYHYNALDQLVGVLQGPRPQWRQFRYDSLGRLTHQYLPEKLPTLNDMGQYTGPRGRWTDVFVYDERSNLTSHTDARGVKAIYDYSGDPLNRLQAITYDISGVGDNSSPVLPANAVHYEYMPDGDVTRLWSVTTAGLSTEEYTYDAEGRLQAKTLLLTGQPKSPLVIGYRYDSWDRTTEIIYPRQYGTSLAPRKTVRSFFSVAGSVSSITIDGQQYGAFLYNAAGQVKEIALGLSGSNQVTESYQYEPASQLLERQQVVRSGNRLLDLSYDYLLPAPVSSGVFVEALPKGRTGSVTRVIDHLNPAENRNYIYDTWGRLTEVQAWSRPLSLLKSWRQQYDYDEYGNRTDVRAFGPPSPVLCDTSPCPVQPSPELPTEMRDGIRTLTYDTKTNRITTPGFAYDASGNQIRTSDADGQGQHYQYDAAGRVVKVLDQNGNLVESYAYYGATNERLSTQYGDHSIQSRFYVWSNSTVIGEYEDAATNGPFVIDSGDNSGIEMEDEGIQIELYENSNLRWTKSYIYVGWRLLATITPDPLGGKEVVYYHHPDRLSTRLVTNNADNSVIAHETFPFGVEMPGSSTGADSHIFTTYERSEHTGLDYAVNRYFDPNQGRFTQTDPLSIFTAQLTDPQSLNLYAYVRNRPNDLLDPLGLMDPRDGKPFKCGKWADGTDKLCVIYDGEISILGPEVTIIGDPPSQTLPRDLLLIRPAPNMQASMQATDHNSGGGSDKPIKPEQVCRDTMPKWGYPVVPMRSTPQIFADRRTPAQVARARALFERDVMLTRKHFGVPLEISRDLQFFEDNTSWATRMNQAIGMLGGGIIPPYLPFRTTINFGPPPTSSCK